MKDIMLAGLLSFSLFSHVLVADESEILIENLKASARDAGIYRGMSSVGLSFILGGYFGGCELALWTGLTSALAKFGSYAKICKKIKLLKRCGFEIAPEVLFDESLKRGGAAGAMVSAAVCLCILKLIENGYVYPGFSD